MDTPTTAHDIDPHTDACSCGSDHDHGPTGAEIVQSLGTGFAVLSIAVPALALALTLGALALTPSTPLVLLVGLGLGLGQLAVLVAMSALASKAGGAATSGPGFLVARVGIEEVLRLAVVLIGLVIFRTELRGALGLWIGVGAMLVWTCLTTAQLVAARRRILKPGDWSKSTVLSMLDDRISPRRALALRFADIAAVLLFQVAATVLVAAAPIMVLATIVLAVASGLSTLVVQRYSPERRASSPWVLAPLGISLILALLAVVFVLAPAL